MDDEGTQLEGIEEVPPCIINDLVVMFLLCKRQMGLTDEEVEDCLEVWLIGLEGIFDWLALVEVGEFSINGFSFLNDGFVFLLNLFS